MKERTLVVIKPDGVKRNLIGEIIRRYESEGLAIIGMKMMTVSDELIGKHYPEDDEYVISLGEKSQKAGNATDNVKEQGLMVLKALREYLTEGPVVAMVIEGEDAIQRVRKITGYTDPATADKGTIRGDLGEDSINASNSQGRACRNLIHASGNPEEAEKEINLWFSKKEIVK